VEFVLEQGALPEVWSAAYEPRGMDPVLSASVWS
jgi:hypothetical protein